MEIWLRAWRDGWARQLTSPPPPTASPAPAPQVNVSNVDNVNECEANDGAGSCVNGATCKDLVNDYSCNCPDGYDGKNCDNNVNDITSSSPSPSLGLSCLLGNTAAAATMGASLALTEQLGAGWLPLVDVDASPNSSGASPTAPATPLGRCEGHCVTHADCGWVGRQDNTGLVCFHRRGCESLSRKSRIDI